jgi:Holliday junction resolvase RusA-like endonuclease
MEQSRNNTDMVDLKYRVNIEGYPCQRPRLGKWGVHNSPKYSKHKKDLAFLLKQLNIESKEYEYVCMRFYFAYPASESKKNRIDLAPMNRKYDVDNLVKSFLDALQDSGILKDDRCICGIYAEKLFTTEENGWIEFEFE